MKIENIRLGLATNSSSTHSIIFNLDAKSTRSWEDAEFGWDEFCCNCKDSKTMYLAAALYENIHRDVGEEIADAVIKAWLGIELPKDGDYFYGIDHQSVPIVPADPKTGKASKEFFDELLAYYLRPEVAIVGGNDNDDDMVFSEGRKKHVVPVEETGTYVCRKDPNTGHWVLFNRYNGTKIRLHFDKGAPEYTKAFAPELVDIKITDFCPIGCSFCYQDSTKEGVHAEMGFINDLAYRMSDMRVFEVALGGGEPTMHPEFPEILRIFRKKGIVPNFTTRSYKWMHNDKIREAVKKYGGRFAISVSSEHDVQRAYHVLDEVGMARSDRDSSCSLGFQYVMGSTTEGEFRKVLKALPWGSSLVLLGYKDVGRGSSFKPYDYSNWMQIIEAVRPHSQIGIDTALATQFKDEITKLIDKRLVTFEEGKFSMYVDAVAQQAAPSSYCDKSAYVDAKRKSNKDWIELFGKF